MGEFMGRRTCSLIVSGCALSLAMGCGGGGDDDGGNAGNASVAGNGGNAGTSGSGPAAGSNASGSGASGSSGNSGGSGNTGGSGNSGSSGGGSGSSGSDAPPDVECATDDDIMTGMACADQANGVFAIKTEIDVWWQDDAEIPLVDPGRGKIVIYLRGVLTDVCPDGSGGKGEMTACGTELPPFVSYVNCDAYQITFPDALWDLPSMPKFYTTGSTTGFTPGSLLTIAEATGLIGVDMTDPMGAWPASANGLVCDAGMGGDCFPDDDDDGKKGVSIVMGRIGETMEGWTTGCGIIGNEAVVFRGAPLSSGLEGLCNAPEEPTCVRANNLEIGVRSRIGGAGEIADDCMSGVGDSTAQFVDSRVWGCTLNNGMECMPAEAEFVDSSAPNYNIIAKGATPPTTVLRSSCECPNGCGGEQCPLDQTPSKGPRSSLVRLGNADQTFTCADVRAAPFAAFAD
jgi:hypothetical protein